MAETPADPAMETDTLDDEEIANAPHIGVETQYIKDLSFENPLGPAAAETIQSSPEVSVEVSTSARMISEGRHEVCLIIHGRAETEGGVVFIVELTYGGVILLANIPDDAIEPVLLIEGARLLFPFARNIVADVTRDSGYPPLFLQPIDFMQLYHDQHTPREESE